MVETGNGLKHLDCINEVREADLDGKRLRKSLVLVTDRRLASYNKLLCAFQATVMFWTAQMMISFLDQGVR